MPRPVNLNKFATKKELETHKKEVERLIKKATKDIKNWDVKQDKNLLKKKNKSV